MNTVLTIAGSDSSGGAGIQADLKTFAAHGVYGMSVITSVTSQNTTGVFGVYDLPPETVASQLDAVFTDIFPDSVKIGMVSSTALIETIARKLTEYNAKNIVLDTVMVSTSGCPLLNPDASDALMSLLFPLASIITPNVYEAEIICGFKIENETDMRRAALEIAKKHGIPVLVKGGHLACDDFLYNNGEIRAYSGKHIDNPNTHGTGCTLSSAIAANLACHKTLEDAVESAKAYVTGAIADGLNLGKGRGPLNHMYKLK